MSLVVEQAAMTGDRQAVLLLVSQLRRYREAARRLLRAGGCDGYVLSVFADEVAEIENDVETT